MAAFILKTHIRLDELGHTFCSSSCYVSFVKRRAQDALYVQLEELSFEMRLEQRTTRDSSCRDLILIRLVPVFIREMNYETNYITNVSESSSKRIMLL